MRNYKFFHIQMKRGALVLAALIAFINSYGWGFYAHKLINYHAVFLLPPEMLILYKPNVHFLSEHAVDPDKRRYAIKDEGPRHYIDLDKYGTYPFSSLPRTWKLAVARYSEDSLTAHGIVPWWVQIMLRRLTSAFSEMNQFKILKLSAEIAHYISDAHVPLHASSNHNGQFTGQHGIHGFWESRIPELFAEKEWDLLAGRAQYIKSPLGFAWQKVLESAKAADSVLKLEKDLNSRYPADAKYAFELRNGIIARQYSGEYTRAYDRLLGGMVERRLKESIFAAASIWYTAWVDAGQPDLRKLSGREIPEEERMEFEKLNKKWQAGVIAGKSCD